jgi:catechol 2,3-dioxygenase-like lactoylglutathione lyase family enzyme
MNSLLTWSIAMTRHTPKTRFEDSAPILRVTNMSASLHYYVDILGFRNAEWGSDDFTVVNRDGARIYLCCGGQGCSGTWAWIGVEDAQLLYDEYKAAGAKVRHSPRNYPWALEMHVEDPDGHVLRFGSDPLTDRPFDRWAD